MKRKIINNRIVFFIILNITFFAGCALNPYQQFFHDGLRGRSVSSIKSPEAIKQEPELRFGQDPKQDGDTMLENGFICIGESNFNGPLASNDKAIEQANNIQADVVVIYSKFRNNVSGTVPFVVQGPQQQVVTNQSGSIYGSRGGVTNYSGTSTTTLPGQTNVYDIPYSVDRFDQMAIFWVKGKTPRLGVVVGDLTPEERYKIKRNRGVSIKVVVKGSPAFKADLFVGDIIFRIGNDEISGREDFYSALDKYSGQEVEIIIFRENQEIVKKIKLNVTEIKQPITQNPVKNIKKAISKDNWREK